MTGLEVLRLLPGRARFLTLSRGYHPVPQRRDGIQPPESLNLPGSFFDKSMTQETGVVSRKFVEEFFRPWRGSAALGGHKNPGLKPRAITCRPFGTQEADGYWRD